MAKLSELRKQAKGLGIAPAVIRSATTAEELTSVIADHKAHEGGKQVVRAKAKSKGKTTTARKSSRKATVARKSAPVKRNSARKASAPAKSRKSGKAKRSSKTSATTSGYVPKGGRNVLDEVDFSYTDGWNPRDGSPPDRIIKALRKFRGNRDKVFDFLVPDVWDFVGKKMRNGDKRPLRGAMPAAEGMLAYRIARTAWDFAMRTGQHEIAENRVKYGTGGTGQGVWKPAKKASTARKSKTGSKSKSTARKSQRGSKTRATGRKKAGSRR